MEESGSGGTFLSSNYCPRTQHIHHLNPNIWIQMELNLHQMRHILDNMMRRKQKNVCVCCVYVWICVFVVCVSQLLEVGRVLGALRHPQVSDSMCATALCLAFSTGLPPRPWVTFSFSFFSVLHRPATQALSHISLAVNVCFNSSFTPCLKHNWIAEVNSSWFKLKSKFLLFLPERVWEKIVFLALYITWHVLNCIALSIFFERFFLIIIFF